MNRRRNRQGFSIVAVLALLAMAGSLFVLWTRHTLQQHNETRLAHQRAQAEWLAHAALMRADAQLANDPGYEGETWRLSSAELKQSYAGEVTITIDPIDDASRATAVVELPPDERRSVRHTQVILIPNPPEGEEP